MSRPSISAGHAARRILQEQAALLLRARQDCIAGIEPEALHDFRVALRRCRAALRLFREILPATPARRVDEALAGLSSRLSAIRDAQVLHRFITRSALRAAIGANDALRAFARNLDRRQPALNAALSRHLADPGVDRILRQLNRLAGTPSAPGPRPPAGLASFSSHLQVLLAREVRRLVRDGALLTPHSPPEAAHALRKRVRRLRYWAEFGVSCGARRLSRAAARFHAVATALGNVHDVDVFVPCVRQQLRENGAPLLALLAARRRREWRKFEASFRKATGHRALRHVV